MADTGPEADEAGADVVIEDERWEDAGLERLALIAVTAALDWLDRRESSVVVLGCDDARIAGLNADFCGKPRPTNVLSWPAVEHAPRAPGAQPQVPEVDELGDIALAFETCAAEAAGQNKTFPDHVTHLIVHAVLHLAGYDHINEADAETMEAAERSILGRLGIADPYLDHGTA
ncbi:rRNA maturation RNase YbeY [Paracoccus suum]|uniref:rRNA maturation RNase YbeY n=1 Tax=Paracoccus suum TaxID=2259340 RepID=UPI0018EF92AD|nr:rRNA maturation RNase YbeY [Paracoccus suum]